jgi:glycosyltransferase involved in cell wall biosynthesis
LIEAFGAVLEKVPEARLLLLGDRLPNSPIARELSDRDLLKYAVFGGYRDDVGDLYPAMDVVAMPSLSEGLPLTPLEAMRHSIPVVATRVGGTPEVVIDDVTGLLVEAADPQAMADRIVTLAKDPARRQSLGQAGYDRFEQVFNIDRVARRYEQLYAEVVDARLPDVSAA